jgi:hypothetical protein
LTNGLIKKSDALLIYSHQMRDETTSILKELLSLGVKKTGVYLLGVPADAGDTSDQ